MRPPADVLASSGCIGKITTGELISSARIISIFLNLHSSKRFSSLEIWKNTINLSIIPAGTGAKEIISLSFDAINIIISLL
jgi:hypothetical protein